jgi:hypothetical protein
MKQFLESTDLLQTVTSEIAEVNAEAREVVDNLSEAQLNWKPSADSWSIAQCLEHLTLASEKFNPYFDRVIAGAKAKGTVDSPLPYQPTLLGGWLIRQLLPQATRKVPAPKIFRPAASEVHDPLGRFLQQQNKFGSYVSAARGVNYNRARLRSPVTPLMRYSLADAFVLTVVHCRRHLGQARRVKQTPGFGN